MTSNSVSKKLVEFISQEISFSEFEDILLNQATASNPVRVGWITETGKKRYYDMYWIDGPIGNGIDGGTDTKEAEGMVNISVAGLEGRWGTLTCDTVKKFRSND